MSLIPSMIFHVTTALAFLRHNGVGISKADFLGAIRALRRPSPHPKTCQPGTADGHIALAVRDAAAACDQLEALAVKIIRKAGPMTFISPDSGSAEIIAFVEDPDGCRIELIECA